VSPDIQRDKKKLKIKIRKHKESNVLWQLALEETKKE